jgi:hypothetical protein
MKLIIPSFPTEISGKIELPNIVDIIRLNSINAISA